MIPIGGQPLRAAKVRLATSDGQDRGERLLTYEGTFSFEELSPGQYLLTLEREDEATIGRPVEIKSYPASKVVFLEITLNKESASVREIVTDASNQEVGVLKESPSEVSRKALRAFEQASKESAGGSPAKAIVYLQQAIREQPNYFEAYNNLGVQHQKLRQWNEAIQAYRRAIELRPNSAKAHVNLAAVYLEQGQTAAGTGELGGRSQGGTWVGTGASLFGTALPQERRLPESSGVPRNSHTFESAELASGVRTVDPDCATARRRGPRQANSGCDEAVFPFGLRNLEAARRNSICHKALVPHFEEFPPGVI